MQPPAADVPAERTRWFGIWTGWVADKYANNKFRDDKPCSVKLGVPQITANSVVVAYAFACDEKNPQYVSVTDGSFVGDELRTVTTGGAKLAWRFRSQDVIEFASDYNGILAWGVLTRD
jgi:hypothetical protein